MAAAAAAVAADGVWWVTGMILFAPRPHSCQLYSFYGLLPSIWPHIFYLLQPVAEDDCVVVEALHTCTLACIHSFPSPNPSTVICPYFWFTVHMGARAFKHAHTCTHTSSCHLDSDTSQRVIGLWQEIYTTDKWVLLGLTGEKMEWLKSRGGLKMKGIREELQRRECICT